MSGWSTPRALLTTRARWQAIGQLRRDYASVRGLSRQLGTTWNTVWGSTKPLLEVMAAEGTASRTSRRSASMNTCAPRLDQAHRGRRTRPQGADRLVDLTRDQHGRVRAGLLDLVLGRSGAAYAGWLKARNAAFADGIEIATLDPFHCSKNAIDDQLDDAVAVLDAFHVVRLASTALDQVRRRVQQDTLDHRGRSGDPLYGIRNMLRAGAEGLTDKQWTRFEKAIGADEAHLEVWLAWSCA